MKASFIFDNNIKPQDKLVMIDKMSDADVRKTTSATMMRIYNECKGDGRDRFCIDCDRREGNHWDSTIEFLYEYKGQPYLCIYVQNSSTDSSTCDSYANFNRGERYNGYCEYLNKRFIYDSEDIANVIRCILKEYVYYTYIEKDAREMAKKMDEIGGYKVINPLLNALYKKHDIWHSSDTSWKRKAYFHAEKTLKSYIKDNFNELYGKSIDELNEIYREILDKAYNSYN